MILSTYHSRVPGIFLFLISNLISYCQVTSSALIQPFRLLRLDMWLSLWLSILENTTHI